MLRPRCPASATTLGDKVTAFQAAQADTLPAGPQTGDGVRGALRGVAGLGQRQARDRPAATRDDELLAGLHAVDQLRKAVLGLEQCNGSHGTSCVNSHASKYS